MIRSIRSSSSSSSKTLSVILPLAVEEGGPSSPSHNQPSNTNRPHELANKLQRRLGAKEAQNEDPLSKHGPGARSSTQPIEESHQDKFFGLSQEYSFTHNELDQNPHIGLDPALQSMIEATPEAAFYESRPQSGRYGMDQYLATPRREDAVRYYRP
ncbi:uncharacterized protein DFL_005112 [Arthrobotrys flagrans]|uniref:Uncharacterized protein n=1 Tax=Arthrobotrys flagrans TaxID=97331 RepID=A0A437A6W5_ARTFL|nr:hypothetical protein DFL_005112 [Arthrobotrys flagrans]